MAQNVMGLDLGTFAVKAVVAKMGLRGNEIAAFDTEPVRLDDAGWGSPEAVMEAAGRLLARMKIRAEATYCAVGGDAVTIKVVGLPASAQRRMEQVLRFELDELLPYDIEDAVFDFVEVGRTSDEIRLLCAVTRTDVVAKLLSGLAGLGVDPREIAVASMAYGVDFERPAAATDGDVAVVDIGHTRTNVAVFGSAAPTVRTILRGGRDLTQRLAEVGRVSFAEAEAHKVREGLRGKVGEVLTQALGPLVREIRQTMKGHLAAGGRRVSRVLICGGTARMVGLAAFMRDELGVLVEQHGAPVGSSRTLETSIQPEVAVLGHAIARREELPKTRRLNVRRGPLAFRGDYEYLKTRVARVAVFAFLVLGAWIFSNWAEYSILDEQVEAQRTLIAQETQKLFGKPVADPEEIEERLGKSGGGEEEAPIPIKDAFDVVVELSRRIPPAVVHDVEVLDIKPKRITIKAIVDSELQEPVTPAQDPASFEEGGDESTPLSPTDLIHQKLLEFKECFTAIRIGKVQTVGERRQYQMDIDSKCP